MEFAAQYFADLLDSRDADRNMGVANDDHIDEPMSDNDDYMDEAEGIMYNNLLLL